MSKNEPLTLGFANHEMVASTPVRVTNFNCITKYLLKKKEPRGKEASHYQKYTDSIMNIKKEARKIKLRYEQNRSLGQTPESIEGRSSKKSKKHDFSNYEILKKSISSLSL